MLAVKIVQPCFHRHCNKLVFCISCVGGYTCVKVVNGSVNMLLQICVNTAYLIPFLLSQVWNELLTTCKKFNGIIRLITRFFLTSLIQS